MPKESLGWKSRAHPGLPVYSAEHPVRAGHSAFRSQSGDTLRVDRHLGEFFNH
jgi:hypothetical protein